MTLYCGKMDALSHRVRIVLAEKGVSYDIINVETRERPDELFDINPYGTVPTLVDRDLNLYEPSIITEYLDERFPHPPLMPVYPVSRAKARLIIYRFDREWIPLIRKLESGKKTEAVIAAKELGTYIAQLAVVFRSSAFFFGDEFTLIDCLIAPILWRLVQWEITLPPLEAKIIHKYATKIFKRPSFVASLTDCEQEIAQLIEVA